MARRARAALLPLFLCLLCSDRLFALGERPTAKELLEDALELQDWMVSKRRDLHRTPELGFAQVNTSRKVRLVLEEHLVPYVFPFAKTGFVAKLGQGPPTISLHVPMDGLAINEPEDCLFRSQNDGVMHAAGNDALMTMLLGAIRVLKKHEANLGGSVEFVFEPGSEGYGGAKRVLADGALKEASAAFALRLDPTLPAGTFAIRHGVVTPAEYHFSAVVRGVGTFVTEPNGYKAAISAAASIMLGLQALSVAITQVDATEPSSLHLVPEEVRFSGVLRGHIYDHVKALKSILVDTSKQLARSYKATVEITWQDELRPPTPPTKNDKHLSDVAKNAALEIATSTVKAAQSWRTDDFARFCQPVPCALGFLGVATHHKSSSTVNDLHTPRFKIDEQELHRGAALFAAIALEYLEDKKKNPDVPKDEDAEEYDDEESPVVEAHPATPAEPAHEEL